MESKILHTIQDYDMLQQGEQVAIALSGGKDSVALLHALLQLKCRYDLQLIGVHIHHGIRGAEADRDERFAAQLCEQFGVAYRCFRVDVPQEAKRRGLGEEECGRVLRYEALESLGADKIATAHTLSDSVETMLFHLARGSGSKGLSGIAPVRGNIIRPLIRCTSPEVCAYLEAHGLSYVEDSTNRSTAYARNAIRLQVVPLLKQINPAFESHAAMSMEILREQEAFVHQNALCFIAEHGADAAAIAALPAALQAEVLRELCMQAIGVVPAYQHLQAIKAILQSGGKVQINSGATVRVRAGKVEFPQEVKEQRYCFEVSPGEYSLPIGTLKVRRLNCKQFENFKTHRFSFALDCDKINTALICRSRQAGDRFYDAKRALHKSMKKYLNEIAFEPELREAFPVFLLGENIVGTLGSTADDAVAPDADTKEVLYLYLERE